jgi:hypothetical protein
LFNPTLGLHAPQGGVFMADITNITLSATKVTGGGNNWDITVKYNARFSQFEFQTGNFDFRDGFVLWEDDPFSDDQLTGVVAVSVFNPNTAVVARTMTHRINGDTLDTELGQEELYAIVRLRNLGLNLLYTAKSPILKLSP